MSSGVSFPRDYEWIEHLVSFCIYGLEVFEGRTFVLGMWTAFLAELSCHILNTES